MSEDAPLVEVDRRHPLIIDVDRYLTDPEAKALADRVLDALHEDVRRVVALRVTPEYIFVDVLDRRFGDEARILTHTYDTRGRPHVDEHE